MNRSCKRQDRLSSHFGCTSSACKRLNYRSFQYNNLGADCTLRMQSTTDRRLVAEYFRRDKDNRQALMDNLIAEPRDTKFGHQIYSETCREESEMMNSCPELVPLASEVER